MTIDNECDRCVGTGTVQTLNDGPPSFGFTDCPECSMTTKDKPAVGPLSAWDVKLLVKGDLLRHRDGRISVHGLEYESGLSGTYLDGTTHANSPWSHFAFIGRPGPDGWIPWSGGENPVPGRMVDQKFVDGETLGELSDDCGWNDISLIAFRLAPTAPVGETAAGGGDVDPIIRAAQARGVLSFGVTRLIEAAEALADACYAADAREELAEEIDGGLLDAVSQAIAGIRSATKPDTGKVEAGGVGHDRLKRAIADGFNNGYEQYDDLTATQRQRFDMAADAVLNLRPQPSGETREAVARIVEALEGSKDRGDSSVILSQSDLRALLSARPAPVASGGQHSSGESIAGREAIHKVIHELWQLLDDGETGADGTVTIDQARYQEVSKAMDEMEALVPDSAGPFWGGFPVNYFWGLK